MSIDRRIYGSDSHSPHTPVPPYSCGSRGMLDVDYTVSAISTVNYNPPA